MVEKFRTLQSPSTGIYKSKGSQFLGYAWPVCTEAEVHEHLDALRKEHFKARHHCYAWRFGTDGMLFRANDDREPSGTAGRPILGQIDSFELTDVLVVVVRYFGGTLLGTSGLITAYRAAAEDALAQATIIEKIIVETFRLQFPYTRMPDLMQAIKKQQLPILEETYTEAGDIRVAIPVAQVPAVLTYLKAAIHHVSLDEAATLDFPEDILLSSGGLMPW